MHKKDAKKFLTKWMYHSQILQKQSQTLSTKSTTSFIDFGTNDDFTLGAYLKVTLSQKHYFTTMYLWQWSYSQEVWAHSHVLLDPGEAFQKGGVSVQNQCKELIDVASETTLGLFQNSNGFTHLKKHDKILFVKALACLTKSLRKCRRDTAMQAALLVKVIFMASTCSREYSFPQFSETPQCSATSSSITICSKSIFCCICTWRHTWTTWWSDVHWVLGAQH